MPARLDIALQRNEDWSRTFTVSDDAGMPIDLTGMTVAMQVRDKLYQKLIAAAAIEITDPQNGEITATLAASENSGLSNYANPIQNAQLPYDFRITDSDGFHAVLFSGIIALSRGETSNALANFLYIDDGQYIAGEVPSYIDDMS